jgi:hypothetical protein
VKSLNALEQNTTTFDLLDLQALYANAKNATSELTSKQQQFKDLVMQQRFRLHDKYPFDTERFLLYLQHKDPD